MYVQGLDSMPVIKGDMVGIRNCLPVILLIALSLNASATVTRTRTMGDVGMIVKDDANYWLFPSAVTLYGDQAVFEGGGSSELLRYRPASYGFDRAAGGIITVSLPDSIRFGAFWSEAVDASPFFTYPSSAANTDSKFDLFYSQRTGKGAFGMHVQYQADLSKTAHGVVTDSKTSVKRTGLDIGISGPIYDVSCGYELAIYNRLISKQEGDRRIYGHLLNFRIRSFKPLRKRILMIPFIDAKVDIENNRVTDTRGLAWEVWTGRGLSYRIDENNLFIVGISVLYSHQILKLNQQTRSTVILDLPFVFGGIEAELLPWLQARFGFQKCVRLDFEKIKNNNSRTTAIQSRAPFGAVAGIGMRFKRLIVDCSYDFNFLRKGPYILSGEKGNLFNLVSIEYHL